MNRGLALGLVFIFLSGSFIIASQFSSPMSGQIIAATTAISVATLVTWLYFRKTAQKA
jgi:hypothetical protein